MRFKRVVIIGVGLIGGSLGMAMKSGRLAEEITGVTRHRSTLALAKKYNALDRTTLDARKAVKNADLVIVATPISQIVKTVKDIARYAKKGCIITDVGSVKGIIVREIEKIAKVRRKEIYFVGGHPMAGSEKSGISFAKSNLFRDTVCFLTATPKTDRHALNKIKVLWERLGTAVETVSPQKHDRIVAHISHLPHILAYNLLMTTPPQYYRYAAGSFLDMTRIASSDPELWKDICSMNIVEIDKLLKEHNTSLKEINGLIASRRFKKLLNLFSQAKSRRDRSLQGMVIVIDGPAGSGKSTIGRLVANKLKFFYIDTGAMYRALTLEAIEQNVNLKDEDALINLIRHTRIDLKNDKENNLRVMLNGKDVTRKIRTPEVTAKVFYIASAGGVRKEMVQLQRSVARNKNTVVEGRDIGTVVFPEAGKKFYLDADSKERAKRRHKQLCRKGIVHPGLKKIEQEILKRDNYDLTRKVAPLKLAKDATYIDTTNLNINEVVSAVLSYVK